MFELVASCPISLDIPEISIVDLGYFCILCPSTFNISPYSAKISRFLSASSLNVVV